MNEDKKPCPDCNRPMSWITFDLHGKWECSYCETSWTPVCLKCERLKKLVGEQAEDEALWSVASVMVNEDGSTTDYPIPITEAYLQQELRKLHHAIECDGCKECEGE